MMIPELDTPLLRIGASDDWTLADAVEGTQLFGGVGSGKTTGSGALFAQTFLRHGFGGLVLCAKPNERARWEAYARETGREQSLVIFSPHPDERHQCQWRFNFLDYEYRRSGRGAGLVENIVELINATKNIVEGNQEMNVGDDHWARASNELIRNAVHVLALSQGRLSLDDLYQLVTDAPEGDQVEDVIWQKRSFCWHALTEAERKASTPRDHHNLRMAKRYWLQTYAGLADKTRSSVYSTFSAIADVLLHDSMWELFCTDTTLVPDATYQDAAVIMLDMNLREYGKVGAIAQRLFKYCWQKCVLRRSVAEHPRPVMLFMDEATNFLSGSFDFLFQAECREVRCATVAITQNISNYYAVLGNKSRDEANALLGNFQTKLFHANNDPITNQWAAESIGYTQSYRKSWSAGSNEFGSYFSIGAMEQRAYKVEPAVFSTLRKGGQSNDWQAEAVLFQGGRQWQANGDSWLKASIVQENAPITALTPAEDALTEQERAAWLITFLEWLLIFLHRHNAMDVLEAMQWQEGFGNNSPKGDTGATLPIICTDDDIPVPVPNIAATVKAVLGLHDDDEDNPSPRPESTN